MKPEFHELRNKAVDRSRNLSVDPGSLTPEEILKLAQELQIYKIELEIQNEELQKTQTELEYAGHQSALLFDKAPVGYLVLDEHGLIEQVNEKFCLLTDHEGSDIIGKSFMFFLPPNDRDILLARYKAIFKNPFDKNFELEILNKAGGSKFCLFTASKLKMSFNRTKPIADRLLVTLSDKTALKQTEAKFNELFKRYQEIFHGSRDGIFFTDEDGAIIDCNHAFLGMTGYSLKELTSGKSIEHLLATEELQEMWQKQVKKKLQADSYSGLLQLEIKRKNGIVFPIEIQSFSFRIQDSDRGYTWNLCRDITARKQNEEEMLKLQRAVEQSPASIIITDLNGNIEYVNPYFEQISGYSYEDVIGKNPRILKSNTMDDSCYVTLWEAISNGQQWIGEFCNKKKNGELYWESANISPIFDNDGKLVHYMAIKVDITDKKLMIQQLIEAKEYAEELTHVRNSFFNNMSHELRTPLIGILGFSEMLVDELKDSSELFEMANIINRGGTRLLETLNNILTISKLKSHAIEISYQNCELKSFVSEMLTLYKPIAAKNKIELLLDAPFDSLSFKTDISVFRSIITNLINNAVKFTDHGYIKVSIHHDAEVLQICVEDTGIGIPEEKQQVIFEEFRQVSEGLGRGYEGTGLGLSIVKKYTELLRGTIELQSRLHSGSKFILTFPMAEKSLESLQLQAQEANEQKKNRFGKVLEKTAGANFLVGKKDKEKLRILYVEDEAPARFFVQKVLGEYYEVLVAGDVETAMAHVNKYHFNLVLMDINLGRGIDGVTLTSMIRQITAYKTVPFVAVTAYAMPEDKEEFLSKGLNYYISKPFKSFELVQLVQKIIQH